MELSSRPPAVLIGLYFYPRGGSAHATRALAREMRRQGIAVTLVSGSRSDLGESADAHEFYAGLEPVAVDFTPALASPQPLRFRGGPGTAPIHGSYEDRPGAPDAVLASLDDAAYELQVEAWAEVLAALDPAAVDVLYLHHLTPLNEAAARVFPDRPVVGHVHGTELLMLERIAEGTPPGWDHAAEWAERMRGWAAACERIVVNDRSGRERAVAQLGLPPERFAVIPNGFDPHFEPRPVDRRAHWRRHLVERPRGWRPGREAGSVAYAESDLAALDGTVLVYVGRFTAVKRLPLLIEAFADARERTASPAALVLLGGYPGEWEGEHPLETVERLGVRDVFLAGWHAHAALPDFLNASDLLVHASAREAFGQVLIEAMACERPPIAIDAAGPASIVADGETGWLVPPDDLDAFAGAIAAAVEDPIERRRRGRRARAEVVERYSWREVAVHTAALVEAAAARAAAQ
jgi:glycosyltransferase involved in cell wall biosynthesis